MIYYPIGWNHISRVPVNVNHLQKWRENKLRFRITPAYRHKLYDMHDHITFLPPAVARGDRWNEGYCYHYVGEPSSYHSQFISPGQIKMSFRGTGRPTAHLIWGYILSVCIHPR